MRKRPGASGLAVTHRDRMLLFHSSVILEYDTIHKLLEQHHTVSKQLVRTLPPDDQRFFESVYPRAVREAAEEWRKRAKLSDKPAEDLGPDQADWSKCELCGRPIRQVYYIQNVITKSELRVGSECVKKYSSTPPKDLAEYSRRALKTRRLFELEARVPGVSTTLRRWDVHLDSFPIVVPKRLSAPYLKAGRAAQGVLDGCLESDTPDPQAIGQLQALLGEQPQLLADIEDYVRANRSHPFVATRSIERWCESRGGPSSAEALMSIRESGEVSGEVLWRIAEPELLRQVGSMFAQIVDPLGITLETVNTQREGYVFRHSSRPAIRVICLHRHFARHYGCMLFGTDPIVPIDWLHILDIGSLYDDSSEYAVQDSIAAHLGASDPRIDEGDDYPPEELVFKDAARSQYLLVPDRTAFLNAAKPAVFMPDQHEAHSFILKTLREHTKEYMSKQQLTDHVYLYRLHGR